MELEPEELDRLAVAAQSALGASAMAPRKTAALAAEASVSTDSALATAGPPATESTSSVLAADAPVVLEGPSREGAGPYEIDERLAIDLALDNRLDLRTSIGQVYDAQRRVIVAANAFLPGLDVNMGGRFGDRPSATSPDANLRPQRGVYDASLTADVPWNKVAARNAYRRSLIDLESAERSLQQTEDQVKSDIRNDLRTLLTARESIRIQFVAVEVARRRVNSVELFLQAGRAEIRDLLDAQEALVSAQNELTANLVDYRVAVLGLQRDMGLLETDEKGMWREYDPAKFKQQ
jgi:outer membrane protein TolC